LNERGIPQTHLTLNVGLGTFSPPTPEQIRDTVLHSEPIKISKDASSAIFSAKRQCRTIVSVGTTVVRALESSASEILSGQNGEVEKNTNLFITPGFEFRITDALITNFHVPRSSLMSLVDAFLAHKKASYTIFDLYRRAIKEKMRFYSFGDAMLIR
jgi:S-adenosylmethionine:tRNA ribosyltransferase-isomerase